MNIHHTVFIFCVQGTFGHLFTHRCSISFFVTVKQKQPFGQVPVIQSVRKEQGSHHLFVLARINKFRNCFSKIVPAGFVERIVKGKLPYIVEKCFNKSSFRHIITII
ncbi:hypothetical protein SDC9_87542 [bioreactor metagenome]|uniref:Uncharacterized protein n=1 Tax=bioreactor metagenome TaxID=1076179 RepID=A0A644ZQH9_9ZZZZ